VRPQARSTAHWKPFQLNPTARAGAKKCPAVFAARTGQNRKVKVAHYPKGLAGRKCDHLDAIVRELETAGIRPTISRTNGGHVRFEWRNGTKAQIYFTSATPGDVRTTTLVRANVRRLLRFGEVR
jgi:hypothetical protein